MSNQKFIVYKYIDPVTNEHYSTISVAWDDIYDGQWYEEGNEKIIEVLIKREDNFLDNGL